MRIAVIGAGALGSARAARLRQAGREVVLVARGQRLDWLRHNPVLIESSGTVDAAPVLAVDFAGRLPPTDLAGFCVKAPQLQHALAQSAEVLAPGTNILILQNCIEAHDLAAETFPAAAIVARAWPALG